MCVCVFPGVGGFLLVCFACLILFVVVVLPSTSGGKPLPQPDILHVF